LIPAVLRLLYDCLSSRIDVNVASKTIKQRNLERKKNFSCHHEDHENKIFPGQQEICG
jgi:hypothetical protein